MKSPLLLIQVVLVLARGAHFVCGAFPKNLRIDNNSMQNDRSYDDLIQVLVEESRLSLPAVTVRVDTFDELLRMLEPLDKNLLLIVSAESPPFSNSPMSETGVWEEESDDLSYSASGFSRSELDIGALTTRLEKYFSWYGEVDTIYLLGTSMAVFRMKHLFSVEHILQSSTHTIPIPQQLVAGSPQVAACHISILGPESELVRTVFTVHAFESDSLSLNTILALLKHLDPASVFMVRRVNQLKFDGKRLVKRYFERFGKVLKVFMLPLRSRKKSVKLPSKTGFVVMDSAKCCETILKQLEHAIVPGVQVSVGKFTHRGLNTW